ncbi:MAG: PQQ-binding-like beta-propeller repeat protein [Lentisphaerae bacterium]|nr:PQQ-binding-like beta-propeller repeat protein [Lentisphaerota bacterium]MBT5606434.1 PQQ-binding-like beta-propeller repeat protein [Lentisphaerota bacterium]MBT7843537.1 PQQ-binding-like beta-propeller repeat protein [Lentisphaerota bacterium]
MASTFTRCCGSGETSTENGGQSVSMRGESKGETVLTWVTAKRLFLVLCWPLFSVLSPVGAIADDWPAYLGPHQNGISSETGLDLDWGEEGPPLVWRRRLGESFSPPVVAQGKLIAFHRLGNEEVVECLEASTGESLWNGRYGTNYVDRYQYNGGPRSSPTIDGDRVYTYGAEGVLTCWELQTGRQVWQRRLNEELGAPQEFFGVGTPPVVFRELLLLNPGGPNGAGMVGIDKRAGETVWKAGSCGAGYSAPVVATVAAQPMAFSLTKDGLLVLAPGTGRILYDFPFRSPRRESVNAASPVVVGSRVLLSAAYEVGSVLLQLEDGGLKTLWRDQEALQSHWATSVFDQGNLYGLHGRHPRDAVMRCLDWETGRIKWTSPRLRERLTFIMAAGHFIAMGEYGHLIVFEVNPERYVQTAKVRVLRSPCWAPPVLANGLLYVRNETDLLCLDLRKE